MVLVRFTICGVFGAHLVRFSWAVVVGGVVCNVGGAYLVVFI